MAYKVRIAVLALIVAITLGTSRNVTVAQSGAPGPGWVQLPGGEWVPPDHPLATGQPPASPSAHCGAATIRGTYGIQMQGSRPVPPAAGGGTETMIGVVLRTYDGAGNFSQTDNVKGSVTGIVPDRAGFGTYQVNPDCSGTTLFQPGPGQVIEERFVIVDAGREIRSITSSPPPVMVSTVQQRIDRR
jgi:hypothetical protein